MSARAVNRLWIYAYVLIGVAFCGIVYVNSLRGELAECLASQQAAAARRTAALAVVTDAENAAELALISAPWPPPQQLRENVRVARERTEAARAANPAPPVKTCK